LAKLLTAVGEGDIVIVARLDTLAKSTRDLLNTLHDIAKAKGRFKSLADGWADTTAPEGDQGRHGRRTSPRQGSKYLGGTPTKVNTAPATGSFEPPRSGRTAVRNCQDVARNSHDDCAAVEDGISRLAVQGLPQPRVRTSRASTVLRAAGSTQRPANRALSLGVECTKFVREAAMPQAMP